MGDPRRVWDRRHCLRMRSVCGAVSGGWGEGDWELGREALHSEFQVALRAPLALGILSGHQDPTQPLSNNKAWEF